MNMNTYWSATGSSSSDVEVGKIMAKWAYIGVIGGLIGTYYYTGILNKNKTTLFIGSLFTIGGLAIGSYIGTKEVEKQKNI